MAILEHVTSAEIKEPGIPAMFRPSVRNDGPPTRRYLEVETRIGRSADCQLQLEDSHVSTLHACIRWNGEAWEVRDLGSRNGSSLDGSPLQPRTFYGLQEGALLTLGSPSQVWKLVDASPPVAMAISLDTDPTGAQEIVFAERGLLVLPSQEDPELTVYRAQSGGWYSEQGSESTLLEHGATLEARGQLYRFASPEVVAGTMGLEQMGGASIRDLQSMSVRHSRLQFTVSADEENVDVAIGPAESPQLVRSRAHFYLLVTLARYRLEDAANGVPESQAGWRYAEEICRQLRIPNEQLNVQIFRIRRDFGNAGLIDAAELIERRPNSRHLRIGSESRLLQVVAD